MTPDDAVRNLKEQAAANVRALVRFQQAMREANTTAIKDADRELKAARRAYGCALEACGQALSPRRGLA